MKFRTANKKCTDGEGTVDYIIPPKLKNVFSTQSSLNEIKKNTPSDIYVEVLVVVDKILYENVGKWYSKGIWNEYKHEINKSNLFPVGNPTEETVLYVRKFMTAVNFRYQGQFPNHNLKLHISDILIDKKATFVNKDEYYRNAVYTPGTLRNMVKHFGKKKERNETHFDIVLFMTGEKKLCSTNCSIKWNVDGKMKWKKLYVDGLTFSAGVCLPTTTDNPNDPYGPPIEHDYETYGAAIVHDKGSFFGVQTAAHKIGHVLGALHDGHDNACCSEDGYIMMDLYSLSRAKKGNVFKWSKCSSDAIISFINSAQAAKCLYNKPKTSFYPLMKWEELVAPNVPSLVKQCSFNYREGIKVPPMKFYAAAYNF